MATQEPRKALKMCSKILEGMSFFLEKTNENFMHCE